MVRTLFVREIRARELEIIKQGIASSDVFTQRRCKIILASAEGKKAAQIAKDLGCSSQTVRNAIHAFNQYKLKSLNKNISHLNLPVKHYIDKAKKHDKQGNLGRANSIYLQAIYAYPSSAWAYHYLGKNLTEQKKYFEAIECLQKAISLNPAVSEHYNSLGEVYLVQQQLDLAETWFRKAISFCPNSAWYYQNLGETLAQKKIWKGSVDAYRQALKLNSAKVFEYHQSLKLQSDNPKLIEVPNPVFIVGCGHSGTSIMLAIIGSHPHFYPITYESALFKQNELEIRKTMQQWDRECLEAGNKRWIEKTPPHIFQIQKFLLHRPQSKFILMLRDGRDVVCSLRHREAYTTFEARVDRWIYDNLAGLPYWQSPNVLVVKYEDLVEKTGEILTKVFNFLGEQYTEDLLKYYQQKKCWYHTEIIKPKTVFTQNDHHKLRNWQINQPLFDGRGKWKNEMQLEEKEIFKQLAQQYLEKFGYATNDNW